jgi:hypothetical protein
MPRFGMLLTASAVASAMAPACSSQPCGEPGFDVVTGTKPIAAVAVSDVACQGVVPSCVSTADAGACDTYYVLPVATGNCHVDVALGDGTAFATDVKIVHPPGGCPGLYPAVAADSVIEAP